MKTLQEIIGMREGRMIYPFLNKGYGDVSLERAIELVRPTENPKIIELGTKQSLVGRSTHRREIFKKSNKALRTRKSNGSMGSNECSNWSRNQS